MNDKMILDDISGQSDQQLNFVIQDFLANLGTQHVAIRVS